MFSLSSRFKAILLALSLFLLGAVCGAIGQRWLWWKTGWMHPPGAYWRPPHAREHLMRRMNRELKLTPEQDREIKKLLDDTREKVLKSRREVGDQMRALIVETRSKIRQVLTPEQQKKYDHMIRDLFPPPHRRPRPPR